VKRSINSLNIASRLSPGVVTLVFSYLVIPVLILACFGAVYIFQQGYIVHFVGLLAGLSLILAIPIALQTLKKDAAPSAINDLSNEESLVKPSSDWGKHEQEVWDQMNSLICERLQERSDWGDLKDHALEIASKSSEAYGRNDLAFSVIELLKMTEEISRRYRKVLLTHAPFIERIPCSLYKKGYDHHEKIETVISVGSWVRTAYRFTSLAGVIMQLKDQILNKAFGTVSNHLQHKLKQALLQDVLSVAIDLYSGRFKVEDENLQSSEATTADNKRMAAPLDPLRICLIGQVNSGKSSIINTLKEEVAAETSSLPSTNRTTVYQCSVEGIDLLHLVDLPGFDGDTKVEQLLLDQATKANIILWVLKANQPARALDSAFKVKLDAFYLDPKNRSRKQPVIIGILNHVDRLKPTSEWKPPYALESDQTPKAQCIQDALDYNKELLDFQTILPLSVSKDKEHFNLPELKHLLNQYSNEGIEVQLNQRRNEEGERLNLSDQFKRVYTSGKTLFSLSTNIK
jgi:predicted GTPase